VAVRRYDPRTVSDVIVYSTGFCPYCFLAKRLLQRRRVAYRERTLTRRDRVELAQLAKGGMTFPQIVIDGTSIGGFRELVQLDRNGELEQLVHA
jgi:glutaredoxin 3